mgnify:CR=1 FL=1
MSGACGETRNGVDDARQYVQRHAGGVRGGRQVAVVAGEIAEGRRLEDQQLVVPVELEGEVALQPHVVRLVSRVVQDAGAIEIGDGDPVDDRRHLRAPGDDAHLVPAVALVLRRSQWSAPIPLQGSRANGHRQNAPRPFALPCG